MRKVRVGVFGFGIGYFKVRLKSALVALAFLTCIVFGQAQPANDNFNNAQPLLGPSGSVQGSTVGATSEKGEPSHAGVAASSSIWYVWTSPINGWVDINTAGSVDVNGETLPTRLAVYRGNSLGGLNKVTANQNDSAASGSSRVWFNATVGTTYRIAVDANPGTIALSWSGAVFAGNFSFASSFVLAGAGDWSGPRNISVGAPHKIPHVTVTRTQGFSGRVLLDYSIFDGPDILKSGTVAFDDFDMAEDIDIPRSMPDVSKDLTVTLYNPRLDPVESYIPELDTLVTNIVTNITSYLSWTNTAADTNGYSLPEQMTLFMTNVFPVVYTNVVSDILPPVIPNGSVSATVRTWSLDIAGSLSGMNQAATNADPTKVFTVANFEVAEFRVREGTPMAVINVVVSTPPSQPILVHYRIDWSQPKSPDNVNRWTVLPGDDVAVPHDLGGASSIDFTNVAGELHWDAGDTNPKSFSVPIVNDSIVEFNEDMHLEIYKLPGEENIPVTIGRLGNTVLTILFDDQPAGAVDRTYNIDRDYLSYNPQDGTPGANGLVNSVALQHDGKAVLGGVFTDIDSVKVNRIARVLGNGFPDLTFAQYSDGHSGADDTVNVVAVDSQDNILMGGKFLSVDGVYQYHIARLRSDGSLDPDFNKKGAGADGAVNAIVVQADGKILIGGEFTSYNKTNCNHIARLNSDGSLDGTFKTGTGANGNVLAVATQTDGSVIIGGEFTSVNGTNRSRLARLSADGKLDPVFNNGTGPDNVVRAIAVLPSGKVIIGGDFASVTGRRLKSIACLNSDGSVDTSFVAGTGADGPVRTLLVQPDDNKILVGGTFRSINSTRRVGIARLLPYGAVDTTFMDTAYNQYAGLVDRYHNPYAAYFDEQGTIEFNYQKSVFGMALESSGNVVIGGDFLRVGGGFTRDDVRYRSCYARLIGGITPGPGSIDFGQDLYVGNENSGRRYVSLVRTNGHLGIISATITTNTLPVGPGAAAGTDFGLNTGYSVVSWGTDFARTWMHSDCIYGFNNNTEPYNYHNADVYIDIVDNTNIDGNRYAGLALVNPTGHDLMFLGGQNMPTEPALGLCAAQLEIIDNDYNAGVLGFSSTNYVVNENAGQALVTVVRTNGSRGQISVEYATANSTARTGVDYTKTNGILFFSDGEMSKSFSVPIINNTTQQVDRSFVVKLSNPANRATFDTSIVPTNAFVKIVDDDFAAGHLSFSQPNFTVDERGGKVTVTVVRLGGSVGTLSVVCYTSDGSATNRVNYTGVTNTLFWDSNDIKPKSFTIDVSPDNLVTGDLGFNLYLTNAVIAGDVNNVSNPYVLGWSSQTNSVVTIHDEDASGYLSFSAVNYNIMENVGVATVTVVRNGGVAGTIEASFATSSGTALDGVHFIGQTNRLTFKPFETSKTVTIAILNDNPPVAHANRLFNLSLYNPAPTTILGSAKTVSATVTLLDDATYHEPAGSVDTTYTLGDGFNNFVHSAVLQPDGRLLVGGEFTIFNRAVRNHVARLNVDGSLDTTFMEGLAGVNGPVQTICQLPATVSTNGAIFIGGQFSRVDNVVRNGIARVYLDGTLDEVFDPGSGVDGVVYATAVPYASSNGLVYVAGSFTRYNGAVRNGIARVQNDGKLDVLFDPGVGVAGSAATVYAMAIQPDNQIVIAGDFTSVGGYATRGVARLNTDGSVDSTFASVDLGNGTVRAAIVQPDSSIVIGGTFTNVNGYALNHIARLDRTGHVDTNFNPGLGLNDSVLSLALDTQNRILVGGEFTKNNGVTRNRITRLNTDGTVDPSINFAEGADSFVSAIAVQSDDRIVLGGGFTQFAARSASYLTRIFGGSVAGSGTIQFKDPTYTVSEADGSETVTIQRVGGTAGTNTVTFMTLDGSAHAGRDYAATQTNVVFAPGETFQTVSIVVSNTFKVDGDRTVNLILTNYLPNARGAQPTALLTITDDDSAVSFSSTSYQVKENAVDGKAWLEVVRTGNTNAFATVDFMTLGGTAVPGVNYEQVTNTTVNFAPGDVVSLVPVVVMRDGVTQGPLTVNLLLTNAVGMVLDTNLATLTILNTDTNPGTIMFSQNGYSVSEAGGVVTLTLIRTNGFSGNVSVDYATADGTAVSGVRYVATNGTVAFADGETIKTLNIPIINDSVSEGNQSFFVKLSNPLQGVLLQTNQTSVAVMDDEVGVGFSQAYFFVDETAGTAILGITRMGQASGVVSVDYSTVDGSATAGTNYTSAAQTLRFGDGETFKTIVVPILQDHKVAGNLNFSVVLAHPAGVGNVQLLTSNAVVVITDGDCGYRFATNSFSVSEAGSNAMITVVRSGAASKSGGVYFTTIPGTALGSRYTPTNGFLFFAANQASNSFVVPIINDKQVEGDQTVNLALTDPVGGQLLDPTNAVLTIMDDDAAIAFSSASYSVNEGAKRIVTVVRSGLTNQTMNVDWSITPGTAKPGINYTNGSGTLVFMPGQTTNSFEVEAYDDGQIKGDLTAQLQLANPTGGALLQAPSVAALVINEMNGTKVVGAGMALASDVNANGVVDPLENVTMWFGLRSLGGNAHELSATLLATNGVTGIAPASQSYGFLLPNGHAVSRPFTFSVAGTNGQAVTVYLQIKEGTNSYAELVPFNFVLGKTLQSLVSTQQIVITNASAALPYPSGINVSGVVGFVDGVTVTLSGVNHRYGKDVSVMLAGPRGQTALLMSHCGNSTIDNATLTFSDTAAGNLPNLAKIVSGTYKPTAYNGIYKFPTPAPVGPYATSLAVFNGTDANGSWNLFVVDEGSQDAGVISNGWSLSFGLGTKVPASADLETLVSVLPSAGVVGNAQTYSVTVTNYGPGAATGIVVSNILPAGAVFVSSTANVVSSNGTLMLTVPDLAMPMMIGSDVVYSGTAFNVVAVPGVQGAATNIISINAVQEDKNPGNNAVTTVVPVDVASADLSVRVVDNPNPIAVGGTLTYIVTVTNSGPSKAPAVTVAQQLPAGADIVTVGAAWSLADNILTLNLGDIDAGASIDVPVVIKVTVPGTVLSSFHVSSSLLDPLKANNYTSTKTQVDGPPQLGLRRVGKGLSMSWPTMGNYVLQSADSLTPPVKWSDETNVAPSMVDGQYVAPLTISNSAKFYRLILKTQLP